MSNIVETKKNEAVMFSNDQLELMKRTVAQDATNDELALFVNQCRRTGLDPFTRQIYFIKDKKGKVTVCSSIDGLRLIAERSEKYEGQTKTEWCDESGNWKDIWLSTKPPKAARVGVYKTKFREPTYGVAIFDEYAGKHQYDDSYGKYKKGDLTHMWQKMPALMIGKVAEALALRKAFPNDLSGIYSSEEAEIIAPSSNDNSKQIEPKEAKEVKEVIEQKSETNQAATPILLADYVVPIGKKFKGMRLGDIKDFEIDGYVQWLSDASKKSGKQIEGLTLEFCNMACDYLESIGFYAANPKKDLDEEIPF